MPGSPVVEADDGETGSIEDEDSVNMPESESSEDEVYEEMDSRPRRNRHPPMRLTYDTVGSPVLQPQLTSPGVDNLQWQA